MAEDTSKAKSAKVEYPDTPSGNALTEVGDLNGEDVKLGKVEDALEHGEKYLAAKRKHRWG